MSHLAAALRLPLVLARYRELLSAFVKRELRSRIEGSVLGRVWPIAQPAVLFVIYFFVFSKLLKIGFTDKLAPHGEELVGWRTTFYLITGILPWTALAETVGRGTGVVLENANLIKKIAFPSELLPIYQVIVFHVYFLIGFAILVALEAFVNGGLPVALVWAAPVLFVQMLFVGGITMFLAAANVFVRDIMQAVPVLLTFWMFTTPVFYDLDAVEYSLETNIAQTEAHLGTLAARVDAARGEAAEAAAAAQGAGEALAVAEQEHDRIAKELGESQGSLASIRQAKVAMQYNPMAVILDLWRSIFSYGMLPFPVTRLLNMFLVGVVVMLLGYAYFLRSKGRFADEV